MMVVPSWAVTLTGIDVVPTTSGILCDAVPDVTTVPFTFTVAPALVVAGVKVIEVTPFTTDAV